MRNRRRRSVRRKDHGRKRSCGGLPGSSFSGRIFFAAVEGNKDVSYVAQRRFIEVKMKII